MPEKNITATTTDMTNRVDDFSVDTAATDGPGDQNETFYDNTEWSQNFGYYKTIPELSAVIDAKATWTVGKGFKADEVTTLLLDTIKGWGKDTFNTIIENMIRTYNIAGDSFAEIIRDKEGNLVNLKSLDPGSMRIVVNKQGRIKRYEQVNKSQETENIKFRPNKIFHLARNRVADEIHGVSMVEKLSTIILMKNEAMDDWKTVLHRNVVPVKIIKVDSDNPTKLAAIQKQYEDAINKKEVMVITKDAVEIEDASVAPNATLNPLPWIDNLDAKFYEAAQVPKIIVGGVGGITEAAVKIAYLAFQQTIEEEQLFVEENILSQLNLVVELEFPASLENELISDNNKDAEQGAAKPSDTTAGSGQ